MASSFWLSALNVLRKNEKMIASIIPYEVHAADGNYIFELRLEIKVDYSVACISSDL